MTWAALFTVVVVVVALVLMMASIATPDLVLVGAVVVLAAAGILPVDQAFAGFANPGMLTVAALFIVAAGLRETGAVALLTSRLLGHPRSQRGAILRLVAPVTLGSSFLNNTTMVATLLPAVRDWARRIGVPPGRLLMPLSFACILGGTCTLIGTSTNLVVSGLVDDRLGSVPDLHALGLFEITPLGLPVAIVGCLVLVVTAPWLLPDRQPAVSRNDDPRHYTMEVIVPPGSRLAGKTIEAAGLRHQPGAFLMEIVRDGHVLAAVDHGQLLREGDRLVFVGDVDAVVDLQRFPGLAAARDQVFKMAGDRLQRRIVEAVVSERNPLVGQTIRDGGFRNRYQAVVIAVARAGERLTGRIGDIVLRSGDVLLLEGHRDFVDQQRTRTDFYLVSPVEGAAPPRFERALPAMLILAALVVTVTFDLLSTVVAAFLAAGAMVLTRCCTLDEARRSLDIPVLVAIASAFGLGAALEITGVDAFVAEKAITAGASNPHVALLLICLVTMLLTEMVSNNAAAVLAFPLGLSLAAQLGVSPMPFVFTVMMSASASFLTPIGYQTNLMVMGPGGYRPTDYIRLGLPLSIVVVVVTVGLAPVIWPF